MAQSSYPQAGLFPADGPDCGAYTANEWRALLLSFMRAGGMVNTGAAAPPGLPATPMYPNVGVFYVIPDRLAVTSTGNNKVSIATGAWLCDGTFGYNDTAITDAAIVSPAANPRIDRVVVRQNYSGADYTSVNVPSLVVLNNTAHLCVISGAEAGAPVAPALTQDQDRSTYWDIPLYQYQISIAGAITNITDEREWVDAEMKHFFVSVQVGYDNTAPVSSVPIEGEFADFYLSMLDNQDFRGLGRFIVPNNYIATMTATAVLMPCANGNIWGTNIYYAGECGENKGTHNASVGPTAVAVTNPPYNCIQVLTVANIGTEDLVTLSYRREAANVNDTINDCVHFYGWIVEYLGWGRK